MSPSRFQAEASTLVTVLEKTLLENVMASQSKACSAVQDPLQPGNQANTIMLDARKRKGLKPEPAPLNEYEDKL